MRRMTKQIGVAGATLVAVAALAAVPSGVQAQPQQAAGAPPALLDVGGPAPSTPAPGRGARSADVDTSLLRAGRPQTVTVDVVSDDLVVDLEPSASGVPGWSAWQGDIAGDPAGSATIVRKGDDVAGLISSTTGTYRIRTTAPGQQVVQQVTRTFPEAADDALTPPTSGIRTPSADAAPGPGAAPRTNAAPAPAGDVPTHPVIDVLVAYTPAAATAIGGTGPMNAEIALAISTTNDAYANSGVAGQLRLAGTTALTENLSLSNQSLNWLTAPSDGHSDQVHALRASSGADLVSTWVDDPSSCGLGWVLNGTTDPASRSQYGFSTVDWSCAVDNLSFPHELGHNMGLEHDRYVTPNPRLYPYAVGYVNVAKRWRTIMAYNDECSAQPTPVYCDRLPRFSNPDQLYDGVPLGRPSTGPNPADERKALNNTHGFVAAWRAKTAPFTSWPKFVAQQYADFRGRAPTSAESSAASGDLSTGARTPESFIESELRGAFGAAYAPVARLYFAYFVRSPDPGGLDYWVRRYRGGMRLTAISSNFAASSEFKSKYGTLGNRAFVEKIYRNLFERTGDPNGITYWTGKLDRREKTRGEVMINFSESSEFKRVRAEEIDVVLLYRSLLQRAATPTEFADQVARLQGGAGIQRLILEVLASAEYADRITP